MREITGNLWDFYGKPNHVICLTTNGTIKKNGEGVMGRGCAYEATQRIPGIAGVLGAALRANGNAPQWLQYTPPVIMFPVKYQWFDKADIDLIRASVSWLNECASYQPLNDPCTYILPRPGCGNGGLTWEFVKPALFYLPDNVHVIDFVNRN